MSRAKPSILDAVGFWLCGITVLLFGIGMQFASVINATRWDYLAQYAMCAGVALAVIAFAVWRYVAVHHRGYRHALAGLVAVGLFAIGLAALHAAFLFDWLR